MTEDPQADPPTPSIMQLEVTNRNEFPIEDFFDGIPVRFLPGETVTVSAEVALHCFGYPGDARDMALHMAKRYGWASKDMLAQAPGPARTDPRYMAYAANIKIEPIYFDIVRRDRNAPIPADTGGDDDTEPVPMPAETGTKGGRGSKSRRRTPAKLGGAREPKGTRGRSQAAR